MISWYHDLWQKCTRVCVFVRKKRDNKPVAKCIYSYFWYDNVYFFLLNVYNPINVIYMVNILIILLIISMPKQKKYTCKSLRLYESDYGIIYIWSYCVFTKVLFIHNFARNWILKRENKSVKSNRYWFFFLSLEQYHICMTKVNTALLIIFFSLR